MLTAALEVAPVVLPLMMARMTRRTKTRIAAAVAEGAEIVDVGEALEVASGAEKIGRRKKEAEVEVAATTKKRIRRRKGGGPDARKKDDAAEDAVEVAVDLRTVVKEAEVEVKKVGERDPAAPGAAQAGVVHDGDALAWEAAPARVARRYKTTASVAAATIGPI